MSKESELEDKIHHFLVEQLSPLAKMLIHYDDYITNEDGVMFQAELENGKTLQLIYKD